MAPHAYDPVVVMDTITFLEPIMEKPMSPRNDLEEEDEGSEEEQQSSNIIIAPDRPFTPRRSTDPTNTSSNTSTSPTFSKMTSLPYRPRAHSPYSRAHIRTRSSASSTSSAAPPMIRAHSSPIMDTFSQSHLSTPYRPSSPLYTSSGASSSRRRSPLRRTPSDEFSFSTTLYSSLVNQVDIGETISENSELDLTALHSPSSSTFSSSSVNNNPIGYASQGNTFPRSRRRPASPLHSILLPTSTNSSYNIQLPHSTPRRSTLHTSTSLPALASAARFNEAYPGTYSIASSSLPSTPTSLRSRSPSISSLETIPDIPDAEVAAQESYNLAKLKAASEGESFGSGGLTMRRGTLDAPGLRSGSLGLGLGARDKRKRWSVCGAERRGDLDLETIWED
ncbi:hypothetical protein MMC25_000449 [Agyrium rufum]|nr:hypothetical protein [Agyrium rufum]